MKGIIKIYGKVGIPNEKSIFDHLILMIQNNIKIYQTKKKQENNKNKKMQDERMINKL